jgi:hypothetical protein
VDPSSPGSRLDADHPKNGVLIPCLITVQAARRRDTAVDESLGKTFAAAMGAIGEYDNRVRVMLQTRSELFESELQRAERAFTGLSRALTEGASLLASELGRGASA